MTMKMNTDTLNVLRNMKEELDIFIDSAYEFRLKPRTIIDAWNFRAHLIKQIDWVSAAMNVTAMPNELVVPTEE